MTLIDRVLTRIDGALQDIAARDPAIRAFCDVRADAARAEAASLDRLPVDRRGALHGVPVAVKEVYDVAGCRCAWGTPIHADRRPAHDCDAVSRLKAAGAVVIGTVASTEYAMARAAPTCNPHAPDRSPGASSSGSAAAVAAGFVDLALGSQTIGSGIRPAAYCGVLGLKPTHGLVDLSGVMPLSEPLDHAAIMARDVDLLGKALAVLGRRDVTTTTLAASRIALVEPWFDEAVDARMWQCVLAAARHLADGRLATLAIPDAVVGAERECLETILAADMWRHHAQDERSAGARMSEALKAWLARGRQVDAGAYRHELARRARLVQAMEARVDAVDVIATVATTGVAPLRSDGTGSRAPQRLWTLLGWPALSVPVGLLDGLPVAVQLIARPHEEQRLLAAARRLADAHAAPRPTQPASDAVH